VEAVDEPAGALLTAKVEALVGLGASSEPRLEHAAAQDRAAAILPLGPSEENDAAPKDASLEDTKRPSRVEDSATSKADDPHKDIDRRTVAQRGPPARPQAAAGTEVGNGMVRDNEPKTGSGAAPSNSQKSDDDRARTANEPRIFVPPRAPDDPGPDVDEAELASGHYGAPGAKV
jgi:hypothetical protein